MNKFYLLITYILIITCINLYPDQSFGKTLKIGILNIQKLYSNAINIKKSQEKLYAIFKIKKMKLDYRKKMIDQKILIFGGSGSLGKTLIKRLYSQNRLLIYSRDEAKHWTIKNEFQSPHLSFKVGDISMSCSPSSDPQSG